MRQRANMEAHGDSLPRDDGAPEHKSNVVPGQENALAHSCTGALLHDDAPLRHCIATARCFAESWVSSNDPLLHDFGSLKPCRLSMQSSDVPMQHGIGALSHANALLQDDFAAKCVASVHCGFAMQPCLMP